MSRDKGGRPTIPDHLKRKHRIDVMVNADERDVLDSTVDQRPRATRMREWALSVARGDAVALSPAIRGQVEAAAEAHGLTVEQWVALACLAKLEAEQ